MHLFGREEERSGMIPEMIKIIREAGFIKQPMPEKPGNP